MEARIQELTRTKTEAVRESIEKSVLGLRQRKKGLEEKQTFVLDAIRQTESILKSQEDQRETDVEGYHEPFRSERDIDGRIR